MAPFTPRVKAGARRQASNYHPDAEPERTFRQRSRGLSRARSTGHSSGSLACQLLLLEKKATGLVSGGTSKFRRNVLRSRRFSPLWRPQSGCDHRGPRGEASALAVVSVANCISEARVSAGPGTLARQSMLSAVGPQRWLSAVA